MTPQLQRPDRRVIALSPNPSGENRLMKALHITAASTALATVLIFPAQTRAEVPIVDHVGVAASITCGFTSAGVAVKAKHADKIVFVLTDALPAVLAGDQAALDAIPRNTELDIKVLDNAARVADLKGKVLSFIGAVDNAGTRQRVEIKWVLYAMVCPATTTGF